MPSDEFRPLVAILNNDPQLINLIATWLEAHGLRAVCGSLHGFRRGHEDVAEFIEKHKPKIVLVDIGMPYEPNWDFLLVLRALPETSLVPMFVTTTNKLELEKAVGATDAFQITGSAENLTGLTKALLTACRTVAG